MSEELGEMMWEDGKVGECVLVECPSRWYVGVVQARTQMTIRLFPAACVHTTGDHGLFLAGTPKGHEITPLPRPIEINLVTADTVEPYPVELFHGINKRSHAPQ